MTQLRANKHLLQFGNWTCWICRWACQKEKEALVIASPMSFLTVKNKQTCLKEGKDTTVKNWNQANESSVKLILIVHSNSNFAISLICLSLPVSILLLWYFFDFFYWITFPLLLCFCGCHLYISKVTEIHHHYQ